MSQDAFALAFRVDVRCVHERAACVDERAELLCRLVRVGVDSPGHGAQRQAGNPQAAVTEVSVFHVPEPTVSGLGLLGKRATAFSRSRESLLLCLQ